MGGMWRGNARPAAALVVVLSLGLQPATCQLLSGGNSGSTTLGVVLPPPSCVTKGQVLRNGDCSEFVQYFVDNPACSAGDAAFKGVVNGSPTPDATCCQNAWDFVSNSCSCNSAVIASADMIDWDQASINCVARATVASSVCNPSGSQQNPCGSSR